jgi:hypothetical protein
MRHCEQSAEAMGGDRVRNTSTGEGYRLVANVPSGVSNAFAYYGRQAAERELSRARHCAFARSRTREGYLDGRELCTTVRTEFETHDARVGESIE